MRKLKKKLKTLKSDVYQPKISQIGQSREAGGKHIGHYKVKDNIIALNSVEYQVGGNSNINRGDLRTIQDL